MDEKKRIETLKKFEILDTPSDGEFDDIVKLAAQLLNVPIAIVSLVDEDRIWFKSKIGLDVSEIPKAPGLCASAIITSEFYQIEHASQDPRALSNPLVAGDFGLEFYAASPLTTKDGYNLGTLCVIDKKPRKLSESEEDILKRLALIVMNQMELRLQARQAIYLQNKLAQMITHNTKGFLGNIPAMVNVLKNDRENSAQTDEILQIFVSEAQRNFTEITNFLDQSARFITEIHYQFNKCKMDEIVLSVVQTNSALAKKKKQEIIVEIMNNNLWIHADCNKIREAVDNLINNAIKFSYQQTTIHIKLYKEHQKVILNVIDEGQGLSEEDKPLLFKRYSQISSKPTGNETSSGVGLWISKEIISAHHGKIKAESAGKNKGSIFTIELDLVVDNLEYNKN